MSNFNSFLYRMINDYIDLDNIIEMCRTNGCVEISDEKIIGSYFDKETKHTIKILFDGKRITGYYITDKKEEVFESYIKDGNYISKYNSTVIFQDENNYSYKNVTKETIYDKCMNFLARREIVDNIHKLKQNNVFINLDDFCFNENTMFIKIDKNTILKKCEISFKDKKETTYSMSTDFKDGVFLSADIKLDDYFLGFQSIDENKYNKLLTKIFY